MAHAAAGRCIHLVAEHGRTLAPRAALQHAAAATASTSPASTASPANNAPSKPTEPRQDAFDGVDAPHAPAPRSIDRSELRGRVATCIRSTGDGVAADVSLERRAVAG
eukprot:3865451-Pleurochrysis_carterae.AAC.1